MPDNYLRPVEIAPGITISAKDLDGTRLDNQFVVDHFAAGSATLTHITESGPNKPRREYWEIETYFVGDDVRLYTRNDYGALLDTRDHALAHLVVLGARWLAKSPGDSEPGYNHPLVVVGRVMSEGHR